MEEYGGLAEIYDYLVSGVDFEGWADYTEEIVKKFGFYPKSVLDLACGTGNTIIPMARRGYVAKGVDISLQMIQRAINKAKDKHLSIDFYLGDIRSFVLDEPVDLVTCFHDGLNYMMSSEDLKDVFVKTSINLVENGLFIFDLNTVKWVGQTCDKPIIIEDEKATIIYNTLYAEEASVWTIDLTCFIKKGNNYVKFKEHHQERGYEPHLVFNLLQEVGFIPLAVFDAFTFDKPDEASKRHFYVATLR